MRKIDLSGEWLMHQAGTRKKVPSQVPGCVVSDLLAAGEIEDPFVRSNLKKTEWIALGEWVYEKVFISEDFSAFDRVVLRFEGVGFFAGVKLNDCELGAVSNILDRVEFDVKPLIKPGKNRLTVTVGADKEKGAAMSPLRRSAFMSPEGSGLCPGQPSPGIWRGVSVLAFSGVRVHDFCIRQDFSAAGQVGLEVDVTTERYDPVRQLEVLVRVCYKGNILHESRAVLARDKILLRLAVKNPQLWWPVGLGDQPLYEVTVDILDGRTCLAHLARRIGLRSLALERDATGAEPFRRLVVNGQRMFLKGASWVPPDLHVAKLTRVEYARLVRAAAIGNMNVLRVWGGGLYESDAFYDLCDEYGVCVWQDVVGAGGGKADVSRSSQLPLLESELRDQVRRLRHHPCLVLWCGGVGGEASTEGVCQQMAERVLAEQDPGTPFLPPVRHEPFSLGGGLEGAAWASFPEPRAVSGYLSESDCNVSNPVCAFHTTSAEAVNQMFRGFLSQYLLPSGFDNTLWLSQIQQGVELKRAYEAARTGRDDPGGFIFWRLNDCWPSCSPSALDYSGCWKAAHYLARRFFAPLGLCGVYRPEDGQVELSAFHDSGRKAFKGELQWRVTQMDGWVVQEGVKKVSLPPFFAGKVARVNVEESLAKAGAANVVMWLYLLDEQGNQVSWDMVLFCEPRELALPPARMRAEIRVWDDNSFAVTLTSRHPALWVWLSLEGMAARYDDNFFSLEPDKPFRVRITPASRLKLDQFRQLLRIGSLRDTWQEKRSLMQVMAASKR